MRDEMQSLELLTRSPFPSRWEPSADVYRLSEGWLVKIELAGLRQGEFELKVAGPQLILRGRRRDSKIQEFGQCQSLEIIYDQFERRFTFPSDLSDARISTDYEDGMLTVRIIVRPE